MVNEESFLANSVSSINEVFNWNIVDVVEAGENQEKSSKVVSPQILIDVRKPNPIATRDKKGDDKN